MEKALCALMFATTQFCSYLLSQIFTIIFVEDTFPHELQHSGTSSSISKWVAKLQEFEYNITTKCSPRAIWQISTRRVYERMIKAPNEPKEEIPTTPMGDDFSLHFDGAIRRNSGQAVARIIISPIL